MTNHAVVAFHGQRIGRLIALFVLLFVAFTRAGDMLTLWAAGRTFVSKNNLCFVITLTMAIGARGFFQYRRLSGSGERVANALGGKRVGLVRRTHQDWSGVSRVPK